MLLLISCKSDDHFVNPPAVDPNLFADADLFYTGLINFNKDSRQFHYWKNDSITTVTVSDMPVLSDIEIQNNDVYVAGYLQTVQGMAGIPINGAVWKNGTLLYDLKGETGEQTTTTAMKVVGNDVYAAGVSNNVYVGYWKNGVYQKWSNGSGYVQTYAIEVVGSDVYILGDEKKKTDGSKHVIKYWKNGVEHIVSNPDELSYGADIKVIGNDVYVLGTVINNGYKIAVWKNGVRTVIGDTYTFGYAQKLFIDANDVYVAAYMQPIDGQISPLLFKNGNKFPLEFDASKNGSIYDIYVLNGTVYGIGTQDDKGIIWKNGKANYMSPSAGNVSLYNITGRPKA